MRYVYRGLSIILLLFGITMAFDSFSAGMDNFFHVQLAVLSVTGLLGSGLFAVADAVLTIKKRG